jgi:hypothetical protein
VGNVFLVCEPLCGWRQVRVRARRIRIDWAPSRQGPGRCLLPDAEGSCWSKTTPSTHPPASLSAAFAPAEARRLADRLELHSTPKHGSWLQHGRDRAGHAGRAVPGRRLADRATLEREVAAWQVGGNRAGRGVDWRFTTEDARIKLKHLYPAIQR